MKKLFAYLNGMLEFRSSYTTNYKDYALICAYDEGRDMAHWLTFRKYESEN